MNFFRTKKQDKKAGITLIAAYTKNGRIIGKNGKIPWPLVSERNHFKEYCAGKKIIMGRKSFEEIGHALPYCTIIILSKTMQTAPEGCLLANSLDEAIKLTEGEVIICGGQNLYEQTLPIANKIYATEILQDFDGDNFFPQLDGLWHKFLLDRKEENQIKYEYVLYERKK